MAHAEQEEQERSFRPCAQGRGPGCSNQHERVDFETARLEVLECLAEGEVPAQPVSRQITRERDPGRQAHARLLDGESNAQRQAASEREDQFGRGTEKATVIVFARRMAMPGVLVSASWRRAQAHRLKPLRDGGIVDHVTVEFDPDDSGGADAGLDHARRFTHLCALAARLAWMHRAGQIEHHMAKARGNVGARGFDRRADLRQVEPPTVEMDA
jgi:hypothetical protein